MAEQLLARRFVPILLLLIAFLLAACGGDDGDADANDVEGDSPAPAEDAEADGGDVGDLGSVDDGLLLVPRDFLQGSWCDDEGTTYAIEGDTVQLTDSTGASAEFPLDLLFLDTPDVDLVSQSDDQFVISNAGDEITITRGAC